LQWKIIGIAAQAPRQWAIVNRCWRHRLQRWQHGTWWFDETDVRPAAEWCLQWKQWAGWRLAEWR